MKKLIIGFIILLSFWALSLNITYAETITVTTTEKVPWANCIENKEKNGYTCTMESGTDWVLKLLSGMIKYMTYIVWIIGVLFIVYNGILYTMSWMDENLKSDAKKRIIWTILWLVVLFLSWPILKIIAPWIYT